MGIPEEIRKVPRPRNTIVVLSGKTGPNRYAVRSRNGFKYGSKGNPQPINGPIIGHIVDGKYVPKNEPLTLSEPDMLSFGGVAFVRSCVGDLLDDLYSVYSVEDAQKILVLAALRVLKPRVTARRVSSEYHRTFLSHFYPGLTLSENTVGSFLRHLGENGPKRKAFYLKRISSVVQTHHIAIDGTLKQDTSNVNDLSAFSHKARVKGCRDISVLYAYDLEAKIPICAEVFPGNSIDATSYRSFITDNDIRKGIILADKGFPPSQIADELSKRPELHFITPLKRNDARIKNHDMYNFQGVLKGFDKAIFYKKESLRGGRFLYGFRNTHLAAMEEHSFAESAKAHDNFDNAQFMHKKDAFGSIVFESDQDLAPEVVYRCYADRWQIELVFQRYKSDEGLDQTRVQTDFSVIGSEFINFVATTLTCRMLQKAQDAGLLKNDSWSDLMDDLSSAWRKVDGPKNPRADDDAWVHTLPSVMKLLQALGLCESASDNVTTVKEPRKPVRPKGSKNRKAKDQQAQKNEQDEQDKPKRKPGRPKGRKNNKTLEREANQAAEDAAGSTAKISKATPKDKSGCAAASTSSKTDGKTVKATKNLQPLKRHRRVKLSQNKASAATSDESGKAET